MIKDQVELMNKAHALTVRAINERDTLTRAFEIGLYTNAIALNVAAGSLSVERYGEIVSILDDLDRELTKLGY